MGYTKNQCTCASVTILNISNYSDLPSCLECCLVNGAKLNCYIQEVPIPQLFVRCLVVVVLAHLVTT